MTWRHLRVRMFWRDFIFRGVSRPVKAFMEGEWKIFVAILESSKYLEVFDGLDLTL